VDYLSEVYWERIGFIVEKARELGMQAWLYDEYNWPSGAVGGRLLRDHPEYRQRYLDCVVRAPLRVLVAGVAGLAADWQLLTVLDIMQQDRSTSLWPVPEDDRPAVTTASGQRVRLSRRKGRAGSTPRPDAETWLFKISGR